ncbi:MAG: UbiX family flavin prenyltransferase [Candidatus Bathyarchaeia archaeon]
MRKVVSLNLLVGERMRLVVAITGASGSVYGKRLLEVLREKGVETHLIVTKVAEEIMKDEIGLSKEEVARLATRLYANDDLSASITSGSFNTAGMVIVPCSTKTLAGIAHGYSDNLVLRAADVTIKERRKLVLVIRETPLSAIHLKNMLYLAKLGVVILPASPAFYFKPKTIDDLANFIVGKILESFGMEHTLYKKWGELG